MKEPERLKLTNNPSSKSVKPIPLVGSTVEDNFPDEMNYKTYWKIFVVENENNSKNNS